MAVKEMLVAPKVKDPSIEELAEAVTMLNDFVMVKPIEKPVSDIIVESDHWKKDADMAVVIAVGEGRIINGQMFPIRCKTGDIVSITKYGQDKPVLGVRCKMVHASEVHYISNE